jgi:transposase
VFIDETWAKTNMTRTHGRAPRGERLNAKAPFGKWRTLTFLAALRHDRIDAPCVLDGPINGQLFTTYVEQFLIPTLSPGDIVIMDNLGSHRGRAVRKAIRAAGARLLFLPKYSPDLNPIEQAAGSAATAGFHASPIVRQLDSLVSRHGAAEDDNPDSTSAAAKVGAVARLAAKRLARALPFPFGANCIVIRRRFRCLGRTSLAFGSLLLSSD